MCLVSFEFNSCIKMEANNSSVMLHAMFPGIARLHNIMGKGSALDSGGFIGYIIFWIAVSCFLTIPIPKMRVLVCKLCPLRFIMSRIMLKLEDVKLVVYLISAVAMLAWCLTLAGGAGPVIRQPSQVHGSAKAWLMVRFVFVSMGSSATFAR